MRVEIGANRDRNRRADVLGAGASTAERSAIDRLVAAHGVPASRAPGDTVVRGGWAQRKRQRSLLLPGLHALVDSHGWVSQAGLAHLCSRLNIPLAEAWGVATFYDLVPTDQNALSSGDGAIVRVCTDIVCSALSPGARHEWAPGRTSAACLGQCDAGGAQLDKVIGHPYVERRGAQTDSQLTSAGESVRDSPAPRVSATPAASTAPSVPPTQCFAPMGAVLLRRICGIETDAVPTLAEYLASGGGEAIGRAITIGDSATIDAITTAGLRGRGGAAFPAGLKWSAVKSAISATKHVIANADESEPGTFKDRILIERDPFALIEGMSIAAFATGATRGWIYLRGEYPTALERLTGAVNEARDAGLLGTNPTWGSAELGHAFDIEIRIGGGAYVCGEETALMNSIEGYRGEPRVKPPFPTTAGLFGEPTLINNVETFANVAPILGEGEQRWRSVGTPDSPGTRLFCLSGHIVRPGVYEWPMGTPLRRVIEGAGGVAGSSRLQAVLLGGAAGTVLSPDEIDVELSFEGAATGGATLGSGAVMVFDDTVDMVEVARNVAKFFAHESCGQCVPCRIGTARQCDELMPNPSAWDRDRLSELDAVMADASICGLGQVAGTAIASLLAKGFLDSRPHDLNESEMGPGK